MHKNLSKYFPIFVVPTLIGFTIAFIIPFFYGLWLSLTRFNTIFDAQLIGLQNYIRAFTDPSSNFIGAFLFTSKVTIVSIITVNVLEFTLAFFLTKGLRGTNFYRSVFFTPNLIGGIVLGTVFKTIFNAILAKYAATLTLNPAYGFWGLVLIVNWQMVGYMMIIYIAGIQNLPGELLEAAAIDGATKVQTLFKVTLPMIMTSITICVFLTLTNCFKLFDQNLALTNGAPANQTEMLALNIYRTFYNRGNEWSGVGQAKAVVFFFMLAMLALLQLRITRSKEVES